jgi:hypothetical protein
MEVDSDGYYTIHVELCHAFIGFSVVTEYESRWREFKSNKVE